MKFTAVETRVCNARKRNGVFVKVRTDRDHLNVRKTGYQPRAIEKARFAFVASPSCPYQEDVISLVPHPSGLVQ